jgi:hypothetical protein
MSLERWTTQGSNRAFLRLCEGSARHVLSKLFARYGPSITCVDSDIRVVTLNRAAGNPGFITRDLLRIFRREQPDIVHSRNWTSMEAVFAARLARVRGVVHSEHGRDICP